MEKTPTEKPHWTINQAEEMYRMERWGDPYFRMGENGEVFVRLGNSEVSLMDISRGMADRGVVFPVMLRFSQILDARISLINEAFLKAIRESDYQATYRGVYPIKVNQQQQVIEEVARFGARYHHGLECGSKAELLAALSYLEDPEAFLICNGYKDAEFIDLTLYAKKMGLRTVIVVEMLSEVDLIAERVRALGIEPCIGLRMKLSTPGSGYWVESAGDQSVFGLTAAQLIDAVDTLKAHDLLKNVELLHYHLGSQIPNINTIRQGATEATRIYAGLIAEGAPMGVLDVGGGMAIDYDGTCTATSGSCNYSVEEYCADLIEVIGTVCNEAKVPHPTIVSESGRALVAPYGVLLFNILASSERITHHAPVDEIEPVHNYTRSIRDLIGEVTPDNWHETVNDAIFYRDQVRTMFEYGTIPLRERAFAERCFNHIMVKVLEVSETMDEIPDDLVDLQHSLADIYYGNFSLFQSLPDAWSIDQVFPIMPIHRLNEEPIRRALIADITCDCDGKIDRFITDHETIRQLPLHELKDGEEYIIGVFMVGAYQETLGDLHNLFGDTNVVSIETDEAGELVWSHMVKGDTAEDVLSYVEYEPKQMIRQFQAAAERAVRNGLISPAERREVVDAYEHGMRGYTYFEH